MARLLAISKISSLVLLLASPIASASAHSNAQTSLTLLYQNNLNVSDDANHVGTIMLDPMTAADGANACSSLNETLVPMSMVQAHTSDFAYSLGYVDYKAGSAAQQLFRIQDAVISLAGQAPGSLTFSSDSSDTDLLPVLCTQSYNVNNPYSAPATDSNGIAVQSSGNTYVGFRNQKSFLFLGVPFANTPNRFEYSTVYNQTGQTIEAKAYGADCLQPYDGQSSENCLTVNIQTPYIPKEGSTDNLRPVLLTIPGGGYTTGSGAQTDLGNMVSREDIVGVTMNYRLGTLGFLAVPDTDINGNFGLGDQVTCLQWVRDNIASFGGDPDRITIIGASAGASSVRALLGSPPVVQQNLIAGVISQSNLGGGIDLGLTEQYYTQFSAYPTIAQSYALAGQNIFQAVGCTQSSLAAQIACMKTVPASSILNAPAVARFIVQDGTYMNNEQVVLSRKDGSTANVNVMFGTAGNDGASFAPYPQGEITSQAQAMQISLGISEAYAYDIINSGLFPYYDTGNLTLDSFNVSQRVATDNGFRCVDESTVYVGAITGVFKSAYYYTIERTYGGYDPSGLGASGLTSGPIEPGYPNGNPNKPYFRMHGSDFGFEYGLQIVLRDDTDLKASQLISNYFGQFAKNGDPNPSTDYLNVRGYTDTANGVAASGPWLPIANSTGPIKYLDYPSYDGVFPDMDQCTWLNYSISYYLDGGP